MSASLKEALRPYQERAEKELLNHSFRFGSPTKLQEACLYALSHGGKRFRPALVWMVADALGKRLDVTPAALAVEYFHTASLIADDLPCMDDEEERRGSPTVHRMFGEATALLASYALIAEGYAALGRNGELFSRAGGKESAHVLALILEHAGRTTGIEGASGGQFIDLYPPEETLEVYRETVLKKTISLFEMSLIFGWLFGGGSPDRLEEVKKAAYHYGLAFQIADDFGDLEKDQSLGRTMNLVLLMGKEKAFHTFQEELNRYRKQLQVLGLESPELLAIADGIQI
jgi:geranylgeranyl diphosphate synthase type II